MFTGTALGGGVEDKAGVDGVAALVVGGDAGVGADGGAPPDAGAFVGASAASIPALISWSRIAWTSRTGRLRITNERIGLRDAVGAESRRSMSDLI